MAFSFYYEDDNIIFLLIHPGLVKTDMNPFGEITATESVRGIIAVADKAASTIMATLLTITGTRLAIIKIQAHSIV
jgi:hypothetical protein